MKKTTISVYITKNSSMMHNNNFQNPKWQMMYTNKKSHQNEPYTDNSQTYNAVVSS